MFEAWQASIPSFSKGLSILLLVLNIFFPSLGTFLMACLGDKFEKDQIIVGLIQFFTCWLIVGWIWSIWWGIIAVQKSK